MSLTVDQLKEQLDYDPIIGLFLWKFSRKGVTVGSIAGTINSDGYRVIRIYRVLYYGHRLAWLYVHGVLPEEIDHENGDRADNRIGNLRPASSSQNKCNARRRSDNKSGFKGVYLHTPGRWRARIKLSGEITEVGLFSSPVDANSARLRVLGEIHGKFARAA